MVPISHGNPTKVVLLSSFVVLSSVVLLSSVVVHICILCSCSTLQPVCFHYFMHFPLPGRLVSQLLVHDKEWE
jgi:hypothetical protein